MDQRELIQRVTDKMIDEEIIRGLFLGGSFGRGTDDLYSDVDFIALVEITVQDEAIERWSAFLENITPIVFWNRRGQGHVLLNAITAEWLRCDLIVMQPSAFTGRARDTVTPLIDRDGIYETLPENLPLKEPTPHKVRVLINEFIRILGLLHVVVGRGEYLTAVSGAGMLRDHLMNLMLEEVQIADRGGALHLSKVLPPNDMALLLSLPFPGPEKSAVIDTHFRIAREFLPRAHNLAARLGVHWPEDFESATLRILESHLGRSPNWRALSRKYQV